VAGPGALLCAVAGGFAIAPGVSGAAAPSAGANRSAARREAQRLLTTLALPNPHAVLSAQPHGDRGALRVPGSTLAAGKLVDVAAFWRVSLPPSVVLDSSDAHPPRGSTRTTSGMVSGPSYTVWVQFGIHGRPQTPLLGGAALLGSVGRLVCRRLGLTATS
jgi:hypothetical protein